jgi:hypothetical protein
MTLLVYLHGGDLPISDWPNFLLALAFWGLLIFVLPFAVIMSIVRHRSRR